MSEEKPVDGTDANGNVFPALAALDTNILGLAELPLANVVYNSSSSISIGGGGGGGGWSAGGSGGGGSGGYVAPGTTYPTYYPNWVMTDPMKLNKKTLTDEDFAKLLEECVKIIKPGEKIIVLAEPGTSQEQMDQLGSVMAAYGLHGIVTARPDRIGMVEGDEPCTDFERMDLLARLAVIWEQHPHLRIGQLLAMTLGMREDSKLFGLSDAELVSLVETSWKKSS